MIVLERIAAFSIAILLALSSSIAVAQTRTAPPLEAYGDLPQIEDMALSSDGESVAIVGRFNGQRRLVVFGDKRTLAVANLGDAKFRGLQWAGSELVLVSTSTTQKLPMDFTADKIEVNGVIIVPTNGAPTQLVFEKTRSLATATWGTHGVRNVGGKWMGYFGALELGRAGGGEYRFDHGEISLFAVDLAKNAPSRAATYPGEGHYRDWLVGADGTVESTLDVDRQSGKWRIVNAQGKELAAGVDKTGDIGLMGLGRAGTSALYFTEDNASGETRWYEVPLAGGNATEVFADIQIERLLFDPATGRLLGYMPSGEKPQPVLYDAALQAKIRKVYRAFAKLELEVRSWTPTMDKVLVRTSGNGDSGTWYLVDVANLKAEPVGTERAMIQPDQIGAISSFAWKAGDGMDIDGILTLPPGRETKNLPVIVLPHGGPAGEDKAEFDWWAQAFAGRGYAVLQPNFRGSTNRDHAFMRAGYGEWGRKMQTDLSDGLAALVKAGIADPRRACIMGASYGGYAALAGVTLQQGIYRCAVSVAGVSDLTEMYRTDYYESGNRGMVRASLLESLGPRSGFDAVSPRRHAAQADAPILMIHGRDDTVVPFSHSQNMAAALRRAGKPAELVTLAEEDHWLSRAATRKQMLNAAVAFVEKHNPPN